MQVRQTKMKTLVIVMMILIPTLAAMETEIKPKVLKTVNILTKEYTKLIKYQKEKLDCVLKFSKIFFRKRKRLPKDCR
jgi:RNA polymerase primary sigma factor